MFPEEIGSASKNNNSKRELGRFRIPCHNTFELQGDNIYCFETSDNPPETELRIPREGWMCPGTLLTVYNQGIWLTLCFDVTQRHM